MKTFPFPNLAPKEKKWHLAPRKNPLVWILGEVRWLLEEGEARFQYINQSMPPSKKGEGGSIFYSFADTLPPSGFWEKAKGSLLDQVE
jgi:hypothetical protein